MDTVEPVLATMRVDEIREAYLTILDRVSLGRWSTVIEVLSPANKAVGSEGYLNFKQKRQQWILSTSHWVEIDLLRAREPGPSTREPLPPHEYLVHVSRVDQRPKGLFWPIRLSQKLPVIRIPLRPEDPDATLDLQAVLSTAYDRAGYDLSVDYTREPDAAAGRANGPDWADGLLKAKGLRTA